ncbi:MAG: bacillithiol biosynthesis cysteine-adding enzyme BshC [Balneolaceae bacterium]
MDCTQYSFNSLPFTSLFKNYIQQQDDILQFFSCNPLSDHDLDNKINSFEFKGDRSLTVKLLSEYNQQFDAPPQTLNNIEKLADNNTLAVVTGQQLTLYGGPLFTIYKILRTITLSSEWEKKYNRKIIPVFWLADEDHDVEEISKIGIPQTDELEELLFNTSSDKSLMAADIILNSSFDEFRSQVKNALSETDFTPDLWKILNNCYAEGVRVDRAFGKFILHLFGKYGLVLAGSRDVNIKRHLKTPLMHSVKEREQIEKSLRNTTKKLEENGYHGQVYIQKSNLFYINPAGERIRIEYEDKRWKTDDGKKSWDNTQLLEEIEQNTEKFSPNVFLRPLLQDCLLPTLSYVAGPGEIAYYAQMKNLYTIFGLEMPVISPRFSATIIESGIDRIMDKLPFSIEEYNNRIEDLESEYIKSTEQFDLEKLFNEWKEEIETITNKHQQEISRIDSTLEGSVGKAESVFFTELDKLKGKSYRSLKEQEKIQLNRIHKIKNSLFPNGNLQEREISLIYIMNKYGLDIWDQMLVKMQDEKADTHKILHL